MMATRPTSSPEPAAAAAAATSSSQEEKNIPGVREAGREGESETHTPINREKETRGASGELWVCLFVCFH